MGKTRLDRDKLTNFLEKFVNPFGVVERFAVDKIMGIVVINGKEEAFEIQAIEVTAKPIVDTTKRLPSGRLPTPPAGIGKIKLATIDGQVLQ